MELTRSKALEVVKVEEHPKSPQPPAGVPESHPATKFDDDKPATHLLPYDAVLEVAKVYSFGQKKYNARNWEKGMAWSRLFGASMRHLWAWWCGEDKDPESGLSHLTHAAFCVLCLLAYELRRAGDDDRNHQAFTA